jgi:hypothetical protein
VTVRSAPATEKATWLTTSGITGLTLPGMMRRSGLLGGQVDLAETRLRPEESSRRSLQIFESFIALRLRVEENDMNDPVSLVASTRSSAVARSSR